MLKFQEKRVSYALDAPDGRSSSESNLKEQPKTKRSKFAGGSDAPEHASGEVYPGYAQYLNSSTRGAMYHSSEGRYQPPSDAINNNVDRRGGNEGGDQVIDDSTQPSSAAISQLQSDALQSMLLAWYHSGYATGRYEALREVESEIDPTKILKSANHRSQSRK